MLGAGAFDRKSGGAEVVGDAAVEEFDELHLLGPGVAFQCAGMGAHRGGGFGVVAGGGQPVGFAVGAFALMGFQHDGGEGQGEGGGGGDGFREFHAREVGAERVEGFGREEERRVVRHVGGVDPGLDMRVAAEVGEGGAVEECVVEIAPEGVAAVHAAGDALDDGQGIQSRGGHIGFGVGDQVAFAEAGQALGAVKAKLGGHHRAAGDAGDEADLVEKAVRGAGLHPGGAEFLEHAVGEGGGAHAPAGEGEADVDLAVACGEGFDEGSVLALQGLVLRLVPGGAA